MGSNNFVCIIIHYNYVFNISLFVGTSFLKKQVAHKFLNFFIHFGTKPYNHGIDGFQHIRGTFNIVKFWNIGLWWFIWLGFCCSCGCSSVTLWNILTIMLYCFTAAIIIKVIITVNEFSVARYRICGFSKNLYLWHKWS